ncbi:C163A protein, partial [Urocolius indicus]|nr:C163A protein [Urocolius indicus]
QGSGPIWMDDVRCNGTESALSDCRYGGWGIHNCAHSEDAGVICAVSGGPAELRLVGGEQACAGRVEVRREHEWGTVCDDSWDMADAEVVCRQLACGAALQASRSGSYGRASGFIWMDDVHCNGTESALSDCKYGGWGKHDCDQNREAGVICS